MPSHIRHGRGQVAGQPAWLAPAPRRGDTHLLQGWHTLSGKRQRLPQSQRVRQKSSTQHVALGWHWAQAEERAWHTDILAVGMRAPLSALSILATFWTLPHRASMPNYSRQC